MNRWQARCSCGTEVDWTYDEHGMLVAVEHDSPGREGGDLAIVRRDGQLYSRALEPGGKLRRGEMLGTRHTVCRMRGRAGR